jgi:tRNA pseudouridine55 synthase
MTPLSGLLPIYKPKGMTSKDVSRVLQRRYGRLKIGHVGTLDPNAEGVLPVLIGTATKLQDYLLEMPKAYDFKVKLGSFTDTQDDSGTITITRDCRHVTIELLREVSTSFLGQIVQVPPLYSAVKFKGKELYKHARGTSELPTNEALASLARKVTIHELEVKSLDDETIDLYVKCSKGTYVRTIAYDLLNEIDAAGHVTFLKRVQSAGLGAENCLSLDLFKESNTRLEDHLVPTDSISIGLPTLTIDDTVSLRRIRDGQRFVMPIQEFKAAVDSGNEGTKRAENDLFLIRDSSFSSLGICTVDTELDHVTIHLKRGL